MLTCPDCLLAGDATKLTRDFGHHPSGTLELNALVRTYDGQRLVGRSKPGLIGLQELTGIYLDRYLPKETDVRCGKWTAKLSAEQIECAFLFRQSFLPVALPSLASFCH